MNILMLVLRFIHIIAGIIWGGGSLIMEFFIGRTVRETGEVGQKFIQHLMGRVKLHKFMTAAAVSTALAGAALYWIDSHGLTSGWMRAGAGFGFGVGAVFGLVAFIAGMIFGSNNAKLGMVGSQIQGKPTEEQLAQIQTIQKRIKTVSPIHTYSMMVAMIFMAISRYLVF